MDIKAIEQHYNIKIKSGDQIIRQLQSVVDLAEKKYKHSSARMLELVAKDATVETEEICHWMQTYLVLRKIKGEKNQTNTIGIHTKTIGKSMIPA